MRAQVSADARLRPTPGTLASIGARLVQLVAVLLLVSLAATGCGARGLRAGSGPAGPEPISPVAPAGRLQEVPPPGAVAQLQAALASHHPGLSIEAPADNSLLPAGPWTLKLSVRDWPLTDAGTLGLGAHVVVQIDDQDPIRLSHAPEPGATSLQVELPELGAGSHRVSAYAARPWGEAVKDPGAFDQVRLARVSANPLSQPPQGSPQLIPTASLAGSLHQPVLIDWLLRDAPLQGLRPGDGSWRLRITVNGDSFLVDDHRPLWLRGWRSGSNAVLLELVDGQGAPLNPPFNSLVREVRIEPLAPGAAWESPSLSAEQLALLLRERRAGPTGQTPAAAPGPADAPPAARTAPSAEPPTEALRPEESTTALQPEPTTMTPQPSLPPALGPALDPVQPPGAEPIDEPSEQPEQAQRPEAPAVPEPTDMPKRLEPMEPGEPTQPPGPSAPPEASAQDPEWTP